MRANRHRGFTLVEMAMVIAIAALLFGAIVGGQSLVRSAETQDILATAKDLSVAAQAFKERYHYLPGDFPVNQTSSEIADVSASCLKGGSREGNGNGRISDAESPCAAEHLIRAGFIRGDPTMALATRFGSVRLIANDPALVLVYGFPASVVNLVEMTNIPCDVAMNIVRKIDTGELRTGAKVRASIAACTDGNIPYLAFAL